MRLYVGNLPYSIGDSELRTLFEEYGNVSDVKVMIDRETGRSRGFGFVELDDAVANNAIEQVNGQECDGRSLVVNQARERQPRSGGGGGGYGGGGGGGGYGGGRGGGGGGGYGNRGGGGGGYGGGGDRY